MEQRDKTLLAKAHVGANKYAREHVDKVTDEIQALFMSEKNLMGSPLLKLALGKFIALSYAHGFLDRRVGRGKKVGKKP
jgi:hypothetical protein